MIAFESQEINCQVKCLDAKELLTGGVVMFVQFVFEMYTYDSYFLLWPFCKALDFSKRSNSAVITGEKFRKTSLSTFQKEKRWEVLDQFSLDALYLYKLFKRFCNFQP